MHRKQSEDRALSEQEKGLVKALAYFSIGIGVVAVVAPKSLSRMIGLKGSTRILQAVGAREIASGVGILGGGHPKDWMWSRVAGDVMDLSLLGTAMLGRSTTKSRVLAASALVAGVTAVDLFASQQLGRASSTWKEGRLRIQKVITINRSPEDLYNYWRKFENLPQIMRHLERVEKIDERRSHWVVRAPAGATVEWDAELTADEPGRRIAWSSLDGARVRNYGSVQFVAQPFNRGTEVQVDLEYIPPAGIVGAVLARFFGEEPDIQVKEDLRLFKQMMETGEIATTKGQSHGSSLMRQIANPERTQHEPRRAPISSHPRRLVEQPVEQQPTASHS